MPSRQRRLESCLRGDMKRVFAVYGLHSRLIRYVAVSDELQSTSPPAGCGVIEIDYADYARSGNTFDAHGPLNGYRLIERKIGQPRHSGRCVEVTPEGFVVAVYQADPLLDRPVNQRHTLHQHDTANLGHRKGVGLGGEFLP